MIGQLFVISGPPGAGKSSLCRRLRQQMPALHYSVSHTTRPPRAGEVEGQDYYFVDQPCFRQKIEQGEMLEYVEVFGNFYGTSRLHVERALAAGQDVILEIEVKGAAGIKKLYPSASILIFILPPSPAVLKERLQKRGSEGSQAIDDRLARLDFELHSLGRCYEYLIVNDDLEAALQRVLAVISASHSRLERVWPQLRRQWETIA
jgi:guanylate kinase